VRPDDRRDSGRVGLSTRQSTASHHHTVIKKISVRLIAHTGGCSRTSEEPQKKQRTQGGQETPVIAEVVRSFVLSFDSTNERLARGPTASPKSHLHKQHRRRIYEASSCTFFFCFASGVRHSRTTNPSQSPDAMAQLRVPLQLSQGVLSKRNSYLVSRAVNTVPSSPSLDRIRVHTS